MKPLEHQLHEPQSESSSLAGMLATVSCRLDGSEGGWTLDVVGLAPAAAIELVERSCRLSEAPTDLPSVSTTRLVAGELVSIRTRSRDQLLLVGAHVLRNQVHTHLGHRQVDVSAPELDFMHHLMERSGTLSIRPIETEVYSTWVDVGVSTCPERRMQPADLSLIYDLISGTWHAEF